MIERRRRFLMRALVVAGFKVTGRRGNELFCLTAECNSAGRTDCEVCVPVPFPERCAFDQQNYKVVWSS